MHIVIQNGLKYNAYDSGYSNKQENKIKGKKRGGGRTKIIHNHNCIINNCKQNKFTLTEDSHHGEEDS